MQTKSLQTLKKVSLLLVSMLILSPNHAFPIQSEDPEALQILSKRPQPTPDCTVYTRRIGGQDQAIYETVETHQDKTGNVFEHRYKHLGTGVLLSYTTDDATLLKRLFHKNCINCVKRKSAQSLPLDKK